MNSKNVSVGSDHHAVQEGPTQLPFSSLRDSEVPAILVRVRNLGHEFHTGRSETLPVIAHLNLELESGEIVAIVGPSGSGKTTFLNLIAGRIAPTRGEVLFFDGVSPVESGGLGMVLQQPALLPWRSIYDNVRLPLELLNKSDQSTAAVRSALQLFGLSGFEQYLPSQVSGGMQSRAALARALVTAPRLLLMDEPFGALDELTAENLNMHVSRILYEQRVTALIVTHQVLQAAFLANRVLVFSKRPAEIVGEVAIDFPMPREVSILDDSNFYSCVKKIRTLLRSL